MNNASDDPILDHNEIDAEMIKEWSSQIREMLSKSRALSVKIREVEAKLRAQQAAGRSMSAMNVAAQEKESELRIDGRSMLWLKVNDSSHSYCKVQPFSRLDWSRWVTDIKKDHICLYVYGPDDALHRVHCRKSETPRLAHEDGELWWIVYE